MVMRIRHEILSVFLDPRHQEIAILVAGLRLALTPTEAAGLVGALLRSLERLKTHYSESSDEEGKMIQIGQLLESGWDEEKGCRNSPPSHAKFLASIDEQDQKYEERRARIKATIRDKGLSLGGGTS